MDFLAMKRKDLQALCKKQGIKANLKNSEMAERLSALLLKEEEATETTAVDLVQSPKLKRVKFSPENETDKEESDSDCVYSPKPRKNPRRGKKKKKKEVVDVIEIKDTPVRVTRLSRKLQSTAGDVGNVDGRGLKRGKVETVCDAIVPQKGKVVVTNEASKRIRHNISEEASQVETTLVDKVVIPEPVRRRSQRRTTLDSGVSKAVEAGKLGRESVDRKGAVKRGRVSTRNVGKKAPAEIDDDMAATAVEMDVIMKENQEPSLLKESSLVVPEDVIKPKRRSKRCINKAALTEPKVDVGFKVDEPVANGNESDSCSKIEVVESSRKKRKGSSKKSEAHTKDQLVTSAYSDLGKSMDISACLNENQSVKSEASTMGHTEQNAVQAVENENIIQNENIITETEIVVVENALHIHDGPGRMEVINENIMDDKVVQRKLMCSNSDGWTDPQRMVDDVSCEMVDEVQEIGIKESEEEANTVHSKENEEVNDVRNIGSLATCDSSETSMPKPATGVDIATDSSVTASDRGKCSSLKTNKSFEFHEDNAEFSLDLSFPLFVILAEHKALESEAASPIMNDSETDRVFRDDLTSGLNESGLAISEGNSKGKHIEDVRECDDTLEENPSVSPCQTFYLKDLYEGSNTEDSVIVKSITGNGAVPDDQLASGVIAGVAEDPKLIDQIVTVDVAMDSKLPIADAAEAVEENQLDGAVPCDATLTQLDFSPEDQETEEKYEPESSKSDTSPITVGKRIMDELPGMMPIANGDAERSTSYGVFSSRDEDEQGKDPEMMNLHMPVGENANRDSSGILESLSGEKVDESPDTGICGSDDENHILNSEETEEIELHNMQTPELGDAFPVTASNHGKCSLDEEKRVVEFKIDSPILSSFGLKGLFRDDQISESDLEMFISDSTSKFTEGMENAKEQFDNLQDVIEELHHQEHEVMGHIVVPKFTQEMSKQCQTGSAVMDTNTSIPTIWDDSEVKPCNDDTYSRPQKCSGDLCGLKGFSKAGAENAKEQEATNAYLVGQSEDDMRISEGLEACTTSCIVNQVADENSLLTFGYVGPSIVSPEVVKSLESNKAAEVVGFEVSNLRSNEASRSKDSNMNEQSKCNLGNVLAYDNDDDNAVTDIASTGITEANSGTKNVTVCFTSVEKTAQRLDGDSLPGERNSACVNSFPAISHSRTECDSPLTLHDVSLSCGVFERRHLSVQEGYDSIALEFRDAIKDSISDTPVSGTTHGYAASPLVNSLEMEWLFGEEAHNLDRDMSDVITSIEDFNKGNVGVASCQVSSGELGEHKDQAIEVGKLNSTQELETDSIKGRSLEADVKGSTGIYTTPLRKISGGRCKENNAVTDIASTGITEANSGIKNVTYGVKSVEKTAQRLDGDSLPGERNSAYVKSFSDISRIRTEDVSLSCGVFEKRPLTVQEGFDSIGLKFKYAIEDGISGTPVGGRRQEINTLENEASPLVNSLGMKWLFGAEAHNLDPEMSNGSSNSKDIKKESVGVAQIGSEELGEQKHQAIEVEKLNSSQELELDSIEGRFLEADGKRNTGIYTTPLWK